MGASDREVVAKKRDNAGNVVTVANGRGRGPRKEREREKGEGQGVKDKGQSRYWKSVVLARCGNRTATQIDSTNSGVSQTNTARQSLCRVYTRVRNKNERFARIIKRRSHRSAELRRENAPKDIRHQVYCRETRFPLLQCPRALRSDEQNSTDNVFDPTMPDGSSNNIQANFSFLSNRNFGKK